MLPYEKGIILKKEEKNNGQSGTPTGVGAVGISGNKSDILKSG